MRVVKIFVALFVVVRACGFVHEVFVRRNWVADMCSGLMGLGGRRNV